MNRSASGDVNWSMKHFDGPLDIVLRLLVAAGLVVDAVVHLNYASRYDAIGKTISQGDIFRIESSLALLVALIVVLAPWRRLGYLAAFGISASAFAGVMIYRYVNVGAIGPIPNMYEPIWFGQKTFSAYAEAAAALLALVGLARAWRRAGSVAA